MTSSRQDCLKRAISSGNKVGLKTSSRRIVAVTCCEGHPESKSGLMSFPTSKAERKKKKMQSFAGNCMVGHTTGN